LKVLELTKEQATDLNLQLNIAKTQHYLIINELDNKYGIVFGELDKEGVEFKPEDFIPNLHEAILLITELNNQLRIMKTQTTKKEEHEKDIEEIEEKIIPINNKSKRSIVKR
jgi:hypothetical protein